MAAVGFGVCSPSAVSQEGILGFEVLKVRGGKGKVVREWWDLGISGDWFPSVRSSGIWGELRWGGG